VWSAVGSVLIFVTKKANCVELANNLRHNDFNGKFAAAFLNCKWLPGKPAMSGNLPAVRREFCWDIDKMSEGNLVRRKLSIVCPMVGWLE